MEITIGLILIAMLVLALAIAWVIYIEAPKRASENRQNERRAMIELIKTVSPVVTATLIALPDYDENIDFTWNIQHIDRVTQAPQPDQVISLDDTAPLSDPDLDIARQIVIASIAKPLNDNQILPGNRFSSQNVWQRGINAMTSRQWARAGGSGTYPAIGHDLGWLLRQIENQMNLTGAVTALPPAAPLDERIKLAGTGTGTPPENSGKKLKKG